MELQAKEFQISSSPESSSIPLSETQKTSVSTDTSEAEPLDSPASADTPETETQDSLVSTDTPETETQNSSEPTDTPETETQDSPASTDTPETETQDSSEPTDTPETETQDFSEPTDTPETNAQDSPVSTDIPETEEPSSSQTSEPDTFTPSESADTPETEVPTNPESTDVLLNDTASPGVSLNLDNITSSFITIDEDIITSAANGKPKLLIFFKTDCSNSQATIRNISQYGFSDVDICAIELNSAHTKEDVIAFRNTYASGSNIAFSYYTYSNNVSWNDYMNAALDAVGFNGTSFPFICYIDANNKFQYITSGYCTAATIAANLNTYCNAS